MDNRVQKVRHSTYPRRKKYVPDGVYITIWSFLCVDKILTCRSNKTLPKIVLGLVVKKQTQEINMPTHYSVLINVRVFVLAFLIRS